MLVQSRQQRLLKGNFLVILPNYRRVSRIALRSQFSSYLCHVLFEILISLLAGLVQPVEVSVLQLYKDAGPYRMEYSCQVLLLLSFPKTLCIQLVLKIINNILQKKYVHITKIFICTFLKVIYYNSKSLDIIISLSFPSK